MERIKTLQLTHWIALFLLIGLALVPVIATLTKSPFYIVLFNRLLILAIAATSLNLILGFGGMVSLGHAAFIGIGAYAVGISAHYESFNGFYHVLLAVFFSALFGLVTGLLALRTKGVHFIMITMAFSQMLFFAIVSIEEYGGDDGLLIFERSNFGAITDFFSWRFAYADRTVFYYMCFVLLLATIYIVYRLVNSKFGLVVRACKSNETRVNAAGYNSNLYKLVCYVIAGVICGISGVLLGNFTNFISPEMMNWVRSGELLFMVILGGAGTIFGPLFGTSAFLLLEEVLSHYFTLWQTPFGIVLILVVLYARGGITGFLDGFGQMKDDTK